MGLARQTHAVFIYSPHAHAIIKSIDKAAAEDAPGVVAVLTGKDYVADGLGTIDPEMMPEDMGGPKGHRTKRPPLSVDRVRYVGERVAVVIGLTEAQARDAADLVSIEYDVIPAAVRAVDAVKPGAAQIYEGAASNISFTLRMGNPEAVDPAFATAAHVTKLELFNNRLNAFTMEPRGPAGEMDRHPRRGTDGRCGRARPDRHRPARACRRRQVPRAALEGAAQCRRLYRRLGLRAAAVLAEAGADRL